MKLPITQETVDHPFPDHFLDNPPGDFACSDETAAPTVKQGRFTTNFAANVGAFILGMIISLWYTPFLIRNLGIDLYGLIPLVSQITNYLSIFTIIINSTISRYLTISLEQKQYNEANNYFNTAFFGNLFLIPILLIPMGLVITYADQLIVIPGGQETAVRILIACSIAAFLINTISTPIGVSAYCVNRFDLVSAMNLLQRVASVGLVVFFFSIMTPQLWQIGITLILAVLMQSVWALYLWRKLTPMLCLSFAHYSHKALKEITSMGGWVAVNNIGALLYLAIDLIVVNRMLGAAAGGQYAAVLQWSTLLRTIAGTIIVIFGPTIMYLYARNDIAELVIYVRRAIKFMGLLMALPISLICGLSAPLLKTWLGSEYVHLAPLMSLLTIHLSINLAVSPLFSVQIAQNRVKVPGIVTLVMGMGNLGLAILLAGPAGWGMYGVAAAGAIMLSAKNLIFTPLYNAHCLKQKARFFFVEILQIFIITSFVGLAGYSLSHCFNLASWERLLAAAAVISIIYALIGYFFLIRHEEKKLILATIKPIFFKK